MTALAKKTTAEKPAAEKPAAEKPLPEAAPAGTEPAEREPIEAMLAGGPPSTAADSATGPAVSPAPFADPSPPAPGRPTETQGPRGLSLRNKLWLLLLVCLATMALASALIARLTTQQRMAAALASQGDAIAQSLATAAAGPLRRGEGEAIGPLLEPLQAIDGVAYLAVYDARGRRRAHTAGRAVPRELLPQARGSGAAARGSSALRFDDPATGAERDILDLERPIADGDLGVARVGMDLEPVLAAARATAATAMGWAGLVALAVALVAFFLTRRITRPLARLAAFAERVAAGDLSRSAPVESRDEVGLLAASVNRSLAGVRAQLAEQQRQRSDERESRRGLQRDIHALLAVSMEIAKGDLTQRGRVTEGALGNVVDSINLVVEELGDTLVGVRETGRAIDGESREMIGSTRRMVADAESQLDQAGTVSREVAQVTLSAHRVSDSAQEASGAAQATRQAAEKGQAAVSDTLQGMHGIRHEVQRISKRIKGLGDRSLEISEIADTIAGISSQTNLLALNAAIEASGTEGGGSRFAAVADEVRNLAEETRRAAHRVADLVHSVQREIQEATGAMEAGTRQVEAGFRVAQEAGSRLREIDEISQRSADLARSISDRSREQARGVEAVADGVRSIAEISSRTADSVRRGRQTAERLQALAASLAERLARFKLTAHDPANPP